VKHSSILFLGIGILLVTVFSCKQDIGPTDLQADSFIKLFGNYGEDFAAEVHQTEDDGYILVGTVATHTYGKDIAVIKTDKFGNEEWSKVYGDTLDDFGNSIKLVGNEFIVAGTITDSSLTTNIYLIKLDANGNLLWEKTIGSNANEEANEVIVTSDNGFAIIGSTTAEELIIGPGGNDSTKNALGIKDFYLVKTDQNGDTEWVQNYGANKDEYGTKVIQKKDGGYVLLGSSASFEEAQYKKTSILTIAVNQNGDISGGFNSFGGSENDFGKDIEEVSDGFLILGTSSSFSSSGTDIYLAKSNSTLTSIIWETNLGSTGNEAGNSLYLSDNDSIIIAGYTDDPDVAVGNRDHYLIRASSNGVWDEPWSKTFGGSGEEIINSIEPTSDGGFILLGTTDFEGVQMINLTKLNSAANL
jgi:hypothetical protein